MEDDLRLQLYSNVDLKNEQNPREILKFFDKCFFKFGRFPAVSDLRLCRWVLSLHLLKQLTLFRLLIYTKDTNRPMPMGQSVQFLAALNVFLGGNKNISKNAIIFRCRR